MLVVRQPDGKQQTGTQLLKALVKLFGHKIEPTVTNDMVCQHFLKYHDKTVQLSKVRSRLVELQRHKQVRKINKSTHKLSSQLREVFSTYLG